jgi:hypothetical protein
VPSDIATTRAVADVALVFHPDEGFVDHFGKAVYSATIDATGYPAPYRRL